MGLHMCGLCRRPVIAHESGCLGAIPPEPAFVLTQNTSALDCHRCGNQSPCPHCEPAAPREEVQVIRNLLAIRDEVDGAPEPDEAERAARDWLDAMNDGGWYAGGGADGLAALLRSYAKGQERVAEQRGYDLACAVAIREACEVSLRGGTIADVVDGIRNLRDERKS